MGTIFRPDWEYRQNKVAARELVFQNISRLDQIYYAGLPGPKAIFEKSMTSNHEVSSMTLYENVSSLFKSLEETAASFDCGVTLLNKNADLDDTLMSEFFNFIWLDYCGPLTLNRFSRFSRLVPLLAERNGVFAVTYLAAREPLSFSQRFLPPGSFTEDFLKSPIPLSLHRRVQFLYSSVESMGLRFKLTVQPYADRVPMLLFVFSFPEDLSENELTILPYLKGPKHEHQYTIFT